MITLPLHNSNRTMQLLNKTALKGVPALCANGGMGQNAIAHIKFFIGNHTWYVSEIDKDTGMAFGKICTSMNPDGELDYINVMELAKIRGRIGNAVDRDRYFDKTPLKNCKY
jgi:hypothetical protein